jgi:hypothetical protein
MAGNRMKPDEIARAQEFERADRQAGPIGVDVKDDFPFVVVDSAGKPVEREFQDFSPDERDSYELGMMDVESLQFVDEAGNVIDIDELGDEDAEDVAMPPVDPYRRQVIPEGRHGRSMGSSSLPQIEAE